MDQAKLWLEKALKQFSLPASGAKWRHKNRTDTISDNTDASIYHLDIICHSCMYSMDQKTDLLRQKFLDDEDSISASPLNRHRLVQREVSSKFSIATYVRTYSIPVESADRLNSERVNGPLPSGNRNVTAYTEL